MNGGVMLKNIDSEQSLVSILIPYFLVVFFASYAIFFVFHLPLSGPPDELAHLSYIADASKSIWRVPNYKDGLIIDGNELNFLNHPPLYYSIQAIIGQLFNWNPSVDFINYRFISLAMVAVGLLLVLKASAKLKLSDLQIISLGLGALCIPNFVYIASSVNNDNLAFFGSSLLFYSVITLHLENHSVGHKSVALFYLSVLIIALTKVNVALFTLVFLLSWTVLTRGFYVPILFKNRRWIFFVAVSFAVTLYYGLTLLEYGKLFPAPRYVYDLIKVENPINFGSYVQQFFILLSTRFAGAYGHLSYLVYPQPFLTLLYILLIAPIFVYVVLRLLLVNKIKNRNYFIFDSIVIAFVVTLIVHLNLAYSGYLATGRIAAVQPRYYLFLIPLIWVPFVFIIVNEFKAGILKIIFPVLVFSLTPVMLAYSSASLLQAKSKVPNVLFGDNNLVERGYYEGKFPLSLSKAGHMDVVQLRDNKLILVGWGFDGNLDRSPISMIVFHNKIMIAEMTPNAVRPDVARYFKSINAMGSGFRLSVPVLQGSAICEFDILIKYDHGIYSNVHDASC